jgi:hypothetical protein
MLDRSKIQERIESHGWLGDPTDERWVFEAGSAWPLFIGEIA